MQINNGSENLFHFEYPGLLVQFEARDSVFMDKSPTASSGAYEFVKWGKNNLLPQEMLDLVTRSASKPELINTKVMFMLGNGLSLNLRTLEDGQIKVQPTSDPAIEAWLDFIQADEYIERAAWNYEMTGNVFTELLFDEAGRIASLRCIDATLVRAEALKKGETAIQNYLICPDWSKSEGEDNPVTPVPAYQPGKLYIRTKAMLHTKAQQMGQSYYAFAPWWGSRDWTEVANLIPLFHKAGIKNGYNIRYLIKVPSNYFDDKAKNDEEKAKLKKQLAEEMQNFFTGEDKNGKSMFTTYTLDQAGKMWPGIMIEKIGNDESHKNYIELEKQANINQASAHGVLPSLAGFDTGGKLGGSGSELRIAYQLHISTRTPTPRKTLLKPFRLAAKLNNWPKGLEVGFRDIEITTLDQDPSGSRPVLTS